MRIKPPFLDLLGSSWGLGRGIWEGWVPPPPGYGPASRCMPICPLNFSRQKHYRIHCIDIPRPLNIQVWNNRGDAARRQYWLDSFISVSVVVVHPGYSLCTLAYVPAIPRLRPGVYINVRPCYVCVPPGYAPVYTLGRP